MKRAALGLCVVGALFLCALPAQAESSLRIWINHGGGYGGYGGGGTWFYYRTGNWHFYSGGLYYDSTGAPPPLYVYRPVGFRSGNFEFGTYHTFGYPYYYYYPGYYYSPGNSVLLHDSYPSSPAPTYYYYPGYGSRTVVIQADPNPPVYPVDLRRSAELGGADPKQSPETDELYGTRTASEGIRLLRDGRIGEAIEALRHAVILNTDSPGTLLEYGFALLAGEELVSAVKAFRRALEKTFSPETYRWDAAAVVGNRELVDYVLRELRDAVEHKPEDTAAQFALGVLLQLGGETEAARPHLEAARSLEQVAGLIEKLLRASGEQ